MNLVLSLLLIAVAITIFLQDFQSREVMLFLFPLLGIFGFLKNYVTARTSEIVINGLINLSLILFQLGLLYISFSIAKKKGLKNKLGLGDLLFLVAICFCFSPFNFLVFYLTSLIFSLLLHLAFQKYHRYQQPDNSIALAGLQSLLFTVLIIHQIFTGVNLNDDSWIYQIVY